MSEENIFKSALSRAMSLCAGREYCRQEIRSKLESWGVREDDREKILSELVRGNFINEERYALAFTRDKFRYNRWGRIKIGHHLRSRMIPAGHIKNALASISEEEYRQALAELLSAHTKSVRAKNAWELKGKLLRFGMSRGFESETVYEALSSLEE